MAVTLPCRRCDATRVLSVALAVLASTLPRAQALQLGVVGHWQSVAGGVQLLLPEAGQQRALRSAAEGLLDALRVAQPATDYLDADASTGSGILTNTYYETARKWENGHSAWLTQVPIRLWIPVFISLVAFILVELLTLQWVTQTLVTHVLSLLFSVVLSLAFLVYVAWSEGRAKGLDWIVGYALELMLSFDNMFVFHLIFRSYGVPRDQVRKALIVGIAFAIVMRFVFFLTLASVLYMVQWVRIPFGMMLVWSGIEAARSEDDEDDGDIKDTVLVRLLRYWLGSRLYLGFDQENHALFIRDDSGRLRATMLFVVVCSLEVTDILFALDSVSSKVASISDPYVAFSSTILAMFALRSMYFLLAELVDMFALVKYGVCGILLLIGVELIVDPWVQLAEGSTELMILGLFLGSIVVSVIFSPQGEEKEEEAKTPPCDAEQALEDEPCAEQSPDNPPPECAVR